LDFGHFKNVHIGNSEKSFEKEGKNRVSTHNGLSHRKNNSKCLTIKFFIFIEILRIFFISLKYGNKCQQNSAAIMPEILL
jgi:hypothetical protein